MVKTKAGLYEHYKGGQYRVLAGADDATNGREGTPVIIYLAVEESQQTAEGRLYEQGRWWVRSEEEFNELVVLDDGTEVPRFKFLSDKVVTEASIELNRARERRDMHADSFTTFGNRFRIGTTVKRKTSAQLMTIVWLKYDSPIVAVQWFDADHHRQGAEIPVDELESVVGIAGEQLPDANKVISDG
jgi:hypothetical protein